MVIEIPRTNNFWIDNGIVVLGKWLWNLGFEKDVKLLQTKLKIEGITDEKFEKIILRKLRDNYLRERKKRFLSPFIRQYTTGDAWKENLLVEKDDTTCFFCGRATSKTKHLRLNRAIFPFANIRFPAFLSNRSGFSYVCSFCYILGRLGAFNVFFSTRKLTYFYFIPYSYNLQILSEIEPLLEKADERSNYINYLARIRGQLVHTNKFYEEMLGVFYYCFLKLKTYEKEEFKKINSFYCFRYDGMLVTDFLRFEKMEALYELFSKMMSELEYEALHKIFGYFYSDKNEYLRNEFCKHLLDFSSVVNDIAEILFIKVKNNLYHKFPGDLDRFLNIYYCEVKKTMNEEVKKMCKEVGEGIGIFASGGYKDGKERKNLLYALRNSDTLQKFVNVINSVMIEEFGIAKRDVIQKLLDSLDKRNWELTKEFILAYSLNKYLGIKYAQKMGGEKQ